MPSGSAPTRRPSTRSPLTRATWRLCRSGSSSRIDGIGPSTARKIREFYESGTIARLEELRQKYPPEFVEFWARSPASGPRRCSGSGASSACAISRTCGPPSRAGRCEAVHGLGEKLEQKLAAAIARMGADRQGQALADRDGDADRAGAGPGARGAARRRARAVLRQPAAPARDRRRRRHRGGVARAVSVGGGVREAAHGPRGHRQRGHQDLRPDRDRAAGGPPDRRPRPVRGRLPVLHRLQSAQHQAAPARTRARPRC